MSGALTGESFPALVRARADEGGDRTFLEEVSGRRRTYGEVDEQGRRWAAALRGLGVARGDRVLVMLPASCESVEVWLGLNWLGAAEVPVHTEYRGKILSHLIRLSGARIVVIAGRFLDQLWDGIAEDGPGALTMAVVVGDDPAPDADAPIALLAADDVLAVAPVVGLAPPAPHEISTVLFTSGTSGHSKGVLVPWAQAEATTVGAWPMEDLTADDSYYSVLPLYHIGGKVAVCSMLLTGGRVVIRERFSTTEFWKNVSDHGASTTALLGTMAHFLARQEPGPGERDTPLHNVLMMPLIDSLDEFRERFGLRVCTLFNQTEVSSPISTMGWQPANTKTCGKARPGYHCRMVDEFDREVPQGETGELVIRADEPWTLNAGYLDMPEKTVEAWRNQWLHTGDAFRVDEEGNFYFVDRFKDAIRRRGENISSLEVEAHVNEHPAVLECAAVPVPAEFGEDEIKVVVVPRPGESVAPAELIQFLVPRMPRFMVPRYVELSHGLPKTVTEKVKKAELRATGVTPATWDRAAMSETRAPEGATSVG